MPAQRTGEGHIYLPRSVSIFSLLVQRESGQKEKARQGKGFRFPFPWTPSLKRQRRGLLPSFDPPCRCADLRDTRQKRTFPQGIAACRCRGQKKAGRNLRSRAALRARALWERAANGIRGKVDRQPQPLFPCGGRESEDAIICMRRRTNHAFWGCRPSFPWRAGRRGRRPLHTYSA